MVKELSQPAPEQGVAEGFSCKESDSKRVQLACLHVSSTTEHQTSTDGMEANGHAVFQGPVVATRLCVQLLLNLSPPTRHSTGSQLNLTWLWLCLSTSAPE